jgi:hypothetical protein
MYLFAHVGKILVKRFGAFDFFLASPPKLPISQIKLVETRSAMLRAYCPNVPNAFSRK